jgi:hypothetical protein
MPVVRESGDDAMRIRQLTDEARDAPARLTIAESIDAVTVTDDHGHARTFRPDGREQIFQLEGVPVSATSKWEGTRLTIAYKAAQGEELRYTYSRAAGGAELIVDVQFVERGVVGARARRIYQPAGAAPAPVMAATPAAPSTTTARNVGAPAPLAPAANSSPAGAESADHPTPPAFDQTPDAELRGLTTLGLVVEDLTPDAAACGLSHDAVANAAAKQLSDAGIKVVRTGSEDSYLYIAIVTATTSNGSCFSRFDASIYTHTTATLSYQQRIPVLVQVELLHAGGMTGGSSALHAAAVLRDVRGYIDQFLTRIRSVNPS